ncbi:hypothetical protein O0L34_g19527 [Tuta absoluta]|nr:hypothetical protein O0L34_g19527 [Tuta absoluta]
MADDPGKKKCIYRIGVKYPEKVMNFSKSSTTVMVCGSADGTLLPPYVIYKSTHLYDTWKERGIVGAPCCEESCCSRGSRYNRTTSGWIDAPTFRDWLMTCFLPHAKRLEGRKVLIGDNLSSHFDDDVIAVCEANNISFVCLVPNSTHLCQPLDVGFFRPIKTTWRQTLENWKKSHLKATTVPKESFPSLLRQAILDMDKKPSKNDAPSEPSAVKRDLVSSFKATGIYPLDRERVLKNLPEDSPSPEIDTVVRDSLTDFLREQRYGQQSELSRKKKRLNVEPGKSVSTLDSPSCSDMNQDHDKPDETGEHSSVSPVATNSHSQINTNETANDDQSDYESENELNDSRPRGPAVCQFILAKFNLTKGKKTYHYLCSIEEVSEDKLVVQGYKSQKKSKLIFRVVPDDLSIIEETDIIMIFFTKISR